jgi:hypothetical protein
LGGEDGLDVDAKDEDGRMAVAAKEGHASVVERLVSALGDRLDVNAKGGEDGSALGCGGGPCVGGGEVGREVGVCAW